MIEKTAKIVNNGPIRQVSALNLAIPILGLVGMGISGYLTYLHFAQMNVICLPSMNCDAVLDSQYSRIWSVPLSLLGLFLYLEITIMGFGLSATRANRQGLLALGCYTFALAGVLFSIYLYYLETFEIHALCIWCIGSSVVTLALFILTLIKMAKLGTPLKSMPRLLLRWISQYVQW